MSCLATKGRNLPCKSAFGGIKSVLFANYQSNITVTLDSTTGINTIVNGSPIPEWYQYQVKGNSSLETTVTSSRENGTTFYTQTLNLTLPYLDALTQAQLELLALGRPYIVVEDYYGNNFLCGFENGMELTSGTVVTGAAAGDLSGFTMVFEGMEETAPLFINATPTAEASPIVPN